MGKIDCHLRHPPAWVDFNFYIQGSLCLSACRSPKWKRNIVRSSRCYELRLSCPVSSLSSTPVTVAAAGVILPLLSRSKDELSLTPRRRRRRLKTEDVKRAQKSLHQAPQKEKRSRRCGLEMRHGSMNGRSKRRRFSGSLIAFSHE